MKHTILLLPFFSSSNSLFAPLGKQRSLGFSSLHTEISVAAACQDMDTSNPAVFVNGGLLRMYLGQKVRTAIHVMRSDPGNVVGKSTDDHQLFVRGSPPAPLTSYVEVIGIAESENTIRGEVWTNFGDTFDTNNYNELCQLANGEYKHLFL